eukprot:5728516-Pleurochrysis_carterae.AAC.1
MVAAAQIGGVGDQKAGDDNGGAAEGQVQGVQLVLGGGHGQSAELSVEFNKLGRAGCSIDGKLFDARRFSPRRNVGAGRGARLRQECVHHLLGAGAIGQEWVDDGLAIEELLLQ